MPPLSLTIAEIFDLVEKFESSVLIAESLLFWVCTYRSEFEIIVCHILESKNPLKVFVGKIREHLNHLVELESYINSVCVRLWHSKIELYRVITSTADCHSDSFIKVEPTFVMRECNRRLDGSFFDLISEAKDIRVPYYLIPEDEGERVRRKFIMKNLFVFFAEDRVPECNAIQLSQLISAYTSYASSVSLELQEHVVRFARTARFQTQTVKDVVDCFN